MLIKILKKVGHIMKKFTEEDKNRIAKAVEETSKKYGLPTSEKEDKEKTDKKK